MELNFVDKENQKNLIKLFKKNKVYFLKGKNFNANYLIEKLLDNNGKSRSTFSQKNINLDVEIDQIYLDKIHQ